ncbi:CHAP domain-containing protein [Lentzea albidocapillata subsp. violacea]|uniref:CHAP domain-containing protein n=1 Tax=Lentzea albidocapillata subsp. violacea TaxID=128104 RepID=A0A1G8QHT5_9PSEU|nr:CHAP domain-containing protein [Lentzea albidocapillata]SDJ04153.1 CHAP domain-containing protein [Lentzea albidocapillata subsp. violacea]
MNTTFGRARRAAVGVLAGIAALAGTLTGVTPALATTGGDIANIADDHIGKGCSGNGWECHPGAWCADFAGWVWRQAGIDARGIDARAASFVEYGNKNGTRTTTPHVGDAIVYRYNGSNWAEHVNLVYETRSDGQIRTIGGNEGDRVTLSGWHRPENFQGPIIIVRPTGLNEAPARRHFTLFHEVRNGTDGAWSGFKPLQGATGSPTFAASKVATAGFANGSAQYTAIGTDDSLYHNIRNADGSWQGWNRVAGNAGAGQFQARNVAAAATPNGDLHVFAIGNDGLMHHNVRRADTTWAGWNPLPGAGTVFFHAKSLTATGMSDNSVQLVANGPDGVLYHNIRKADTTWQGWRMLPGNAGAANFQAGEVTIAGHADGTVQLIATGNDGLIYHTVRGNDAAGTWQQWNPVAGRAGSPFFQAYALAMAGNTNGDTQITAVGIDGLVYHNIRKADTTWQGWNRIAGFNGAGEMAASTVAMASRPGSNDIQLVATGNA